MNSKSPRRMYFIMVGANIGLILITVGVVVLGDRILKKQSDTILSQRIDAAILEKEQVALKQAKQDLESYSELQQIAKQIVPQEKDQALTTRQIISLADKAGVSVASIGFPSSSLGSGAKKTEGDTSTQSTSSAISQAKPVSGINGLLALDIVVTSDNTKPSSYNQLINFLASLENNRRTAQVSQISIQPDSSNPANLNFNLTLTVYIKP